MESDEPPDLGFDRAAAVQRLKAQAREAQAPPDKTEAEQKKKVLTHKITPEDRAFMAESGKGPSGPLAEAEAGEDKTPASHPPADPAQAVLPGGP